MKKEQIYLLLGVVILIAVVVFLGRRQRAMMLANPVLSHAIINEVKFRYKDVGIVFTYTFTCKGSVQTNSSLFDCDYAKIKTLRAYFVNKQLPIIYAGNNCGSNGILFDTTLAAEYHLEGQLTATDKDALRILDSIKVH